MRRALYLGQKQTATKIVQVDGCKNQGGAYARDSSAQNVAAGEVYCDAHADFAMADAAVNL